MLRNGFPAAYGRMEPSSRTAGVERLQHHGQRQRRGRRSSFVRPREATGCADQEGSEVAVMSLGESTEQQSVVESWHCLLELVLWERDTPGIW